MATEAITKVARTDRTEAMTPPISEPIGMVPQTMNLIVAFIRLCISGGVIAWRRLT